MRELKVVISGSASGYQRMINETVGITKRAAVQIAEAERAASVKMTDDYVSFWQRALAKREAAEIAADERRIAREKMVADEIARKTAESLARGRAAVATQQATIAAGSIPANMAGGAARKVEQSALRNAEGIASDAGLMILGGAAGGYVLKNGKAVGKFKGLEDVQQAAEKAAKGISEIGHEAHGSSGMIREGMVMVREASIGNWKRFIGSASLFLQYAGRNLLHYTGIEWLSKVIGHIPGVSFLTNNPITKHVLPGIGTALDLFSIGGTVREFFRMRHAQEGAKESTKDLKNVTGDVAGEMRARVTALQQLGKISDKQALTYMRQLKRGSFEDVSAVMNATNPLMKAGTVEEQQKAARYAERLARSKKDLADAEYEGMDNQNKLLFLLRKERDLREQIAEARRKGDIATANELQAQLLGAQRNEKSVRGDLTKDFQKQHKVNWGNRPHEFQPDNLSRMGLFTQAALLFNPGLDVNKQQLASLRNIEREITAMASKPDIWS